MSDVRPDTIRAYLVGLAETGHNPGGVHGYFRAIKAFFRFYAAELDMPSNANPISKVRPPRVPENILPPIDLVDIKAMLAVCVGVPNGKRDVAIILTLFDTGARGSELVGMSMKDYNHVSGEIQIRMGKGGKTRVVYAGTHTRKVIRESLNYRDELNQDSPLFATQEGERLTFGGLRQIITRKGRAAQL